MHVRACANTGASPQDVLQVFMHVAVYTGVPKANHAIKLAKATYAEMGWRYERGGRDRPIRPT